MVRRSAAAASEPHVARAARAVLRKGNAVDAVVAGVLAAAAEGPAVVLGPLQVLVGGAGAGLRAVDGRVRQPGSGIPRPRGLAPGEPVPPPALIGVPLLPAALALVHATLGSLSLFHVGAGAVERARASSAERARLLEGFARRGAAAFVADWVAVELMAGAGRAARGLLTDADLGAARPGLVACDEQALDPPDVLRAPWRERGPIDASSTHVIAATDARGLVAIACYEAPADGLAIPALGLVAPAFARPVLRGEPRVRPGEPCPAAAPIAIHAVSGVADFAVGLAGAREAEAALDEVVQALAAGSTAVALGLAGEARAVAVTRGRDWARVLASA